MATRLSDFEDDPEDPVVSDIESEKDDFNDETFGVDITDLEGNEFDFSSTSALTDNSENARHASGTNGGRRANSFDFGGQQMLGKIGSTVYSSDHISKLQQTNSRYDSSANKVPHYFQANNSQNQSPQQPKHPFRLNFAALSLATQDQQKYQSNYAEYSPHKQHNFDPNSPNSRRDYSYNQNRQRNYDNNQNQRPGNAFQPYSFTGNGHRRPEWDDGDSSNNFQQRNAFPQGGYGRGSYNQPNNAGYQFRNRQHQQSGNYHNPNWQYQREYHQNRGHRFDNADYEENANRERRYHHRNYERRGPHDPFAGLMTWREKLTVLRIQLLQIISDRGPNFDDYYARMLAEKRKKGVECSSQPTLPIARNNVESDENSDSQQSETQRRRTISASGDGNSCNRQNNRNRIPIPRLSVVDVQPYKPMAPQSGTLGKWTATTVTRPRQIIDTSAMQNLDDLQESAGRKGGSKLFIEALGVIERLYDFVLTAEDLECKIRLGSDDSPAPAPDVGGNAEGALRVGSFQSTHMPKPVDPVELEAQLKLTRENIAYTLCASNRLVLISAFKKGRKILPRALKAIDRSKLYLTNFELSLRLATTLCEHLPLLIRRETNAASLIAVVSPLCCFVKSVVAVHKSMPNPVKSDDFLYTVRAVLANKTLSTRSPELVTLLGSLVR